MLGPEAQGPARTKVGVNACGPSSDAEPEQLVGLVLLRQSAAPPQTDPPQVGAPEELDAAAEEEPPLLPETEPPLEPAPAEPVDPGERVLPVPELEAVARDDVLAPGVPVEPTDDAVDPVPPAFGDPHPTRMSSTARDAFMAACYAMPPRLWRQGPG
jgi:hypothetical protein